MIEVLSEKFIAGLVKVFGSRNERVVAHMQIVVEQINELEPSMKALSDEQLRAKTEEFKAALATGKELDGILPQAFATMREAAWRVLGMRHFDVQLIGGMSLHQGKIAEMTTGEGKTLVATLPAYLNALSGKGVHVITVNDYLAARDARWMGPVYEFLGLTVGTILSDMSNDDRIAAYACDITYGTNNEFGFDYLRDNMKMQASEQAQKRRGFTIIDEVDSILIDESRTPLIISGPAEDSPARYHEVDAVVRNLKDEEHFKVSEKDRSALLTDEGIAECERQLGIENFYAGSHIELPHFIENALKAHHLFVKDKDYVVQGGEVVIVDEFTGRLMAGRRWSDGLHQAVEAKEGLKIKKENQTLATITFQNFFKLYDKISGMTGTALTEAAEFDKIYGLEVVAIPTNKPRQRVDHPDLIYGTENEKFLAIAEDVKERHEKGQPILVGTIAIEKSEKLAGLFKKLGIKHNVLNAKQHGSEAEIVAQAGRKGAVTIATNMAGRGTDIVLGGNAEVMAKAKHDPDSPEYEAYFKELDAQCKAEQAEVKAIGGLYVVASERHESRRIDNQLRGRCGRQGDPGETRFYISLEDDLMRIFAGDWVRNFMQSMGLKDGEPIESGMLSRQIEKAQKKVENHNFEIRKTLLEYDEVMNTQRNIIYTQRQEILKQEGLTDMIHEMIANTLKRTINAAVPSKSAEAKDKESEIISGLAETLNNRFGLENISVDINILDIDGTTDALFTKTKERYKERQEGFGETFKDVEQFVLLESFDTKWKDHLRAMDNLRDGINLRAMGGKDPKLEYKREGFELFEDMACSIRDTVSELIMKVQLASGPMEHNVQWDADDMSHAESQVFLGGQGAGAPGMPPAPEAPPEAYAPQYGEEPELIEPIRRDETKVGRNDPCPCGSGKKFKQCCGRNA